MPSQVLVDAHSPSRSLALGDLQVGDRCTERWTLDDDIIAAFERSSADVASVHRSDEHARELGYPQRIVQGMLASLRFSRLLGMFLPGEQSIIMSVSFDYVLPVFAGDTLDAQVEVTHLSASGVARLSCTAMRAADLCVRGRASCLLPTR